MNERPASPSQPNSASQTPEIHSAEWPEPPEEVRKARRVASRIDAPSVSFPEEKRPLAGRRVVPITSQTPTLLQWTATPDTIGPSLLRVVAGTDERTAHHVRVSNARTGDLYGVMDVLYASPGQVYELLLPGEQVAAAIRDGLSLQLEEESAPFWIVAPGPHASDPVLPHLYEASGVPSLEHALSLFCSDASLQPCDWMEVCVLDGLLDGSRKGRKDAHHALHLHLDVFFHPETGQREDILGRPADDHAGGPESTGPFAVLALVDPDHPALRCAEEGFEMFRHPELGVIGPDKLVTESNYNIAYPMMAMATHGHRPDLKIRALRQLELARDLLATSDDLYLRHIHETGEKTFKNWSRGVAWYFLGLVRTLALLPRNERPSPLLAEVDRVAAWVVKHQGEDGLWPCFLKEHDVLPDTSGCAGIAAALAIAVREEMVDPDRLFSAVLAYQSLLFTYTAPDGWLRGVSQSNKKESHHMDIQRDDFRVIAPWGMGLFAQLDAALSDLDALPAPVADTSFDRIVYKQVDGVDLVLQVFHPQPKSNAPAPCMLLIHGGGWAKGAPEKYHPLAEAFRRAGFVCVCMHYRLTDNGYTVFDAVEDAHDAMGYILEHAESLHVDPDRILVCGGSAGSHLAVGLALFPPRPDEPLRPEHRPAAFVLLNPVLDTSENGFGRRNIGDRWRELSPLHQIRSDMPPTLICHGTQDGVVPFQGAVDFTEAMRAMGLHCVLQIHEGGDHGFYWEEPAYTETLEQIHRFCIDQNFLPKSSPLQQESNT